MSGLESNIYRHYAAELKLPAIRRCYQFFQSRDTRFVAHRSLLRDRVPGWIRSGTPFVDSLGSFAYGDTPAPVVARFLRRLGTPSTGRFLDLGCGCGSAALAAASLLASSRGVDLLPAVVAFAREAAAALGLSHTRFEVADVRECDLTQADVVYLAWTSFPPELRGAVEGRLAGTAAGTRLVTVTHPLETEGFERLGHEDYLFSWNDGEEPILPHTFYFYRRA